MMSGNVTEGDNLSNRGWSAATPSGCDNTYYLAEGEHLAAMPKCSLSARIVASMLSEGVTALHPRLLRLVAFSDKTCIGVNWYIVAFF